MVDMSEAPTMASATAPPFTPPPSIPSPSSTGAPSKLPQAMPRDAPSPSDAPKPRGPSSSTEGATVAPFLARHIPHQYAPHGVAPPSTGPTTSSGAGNSRFCYRHRPDLKCKRQADEPSMEQLQNELQSLPDADQGAISLVWSLFSAAPPEHRTMMLRGILTQCCFPQLSFISASVRELIRIDFLSALPAEISFRILCYLDTASLCKAAQVSQRWRLLADDDVVWHRMCEQHIDRKCTKCGWGLPLLERKRLRASKRQIQLRATRRGLNVWSPDMTPLPEAEYEHGPDRPERQTEAVPDDDGQGTAQESGDRRLAPGAKRSAEEELLDGQAKRPRTTTPSSGPDYFDSAPRFRPWKDVYKDRFKVGTNWKYGRFTTRIFRGHSNGIMCLQFDDNILATGSYDASIKIWDIESGELLRTLDGHGAGIRTLQFDDTKLISGSLDHRVKVWNWRTGECLSTFTGHQDGVLSVHFDRSLLASGSMDKTIKIWNFADKSTFLLRGHNDWVNSVRIDASSRTVFSASDDCTVRLWDLDSKRCLQLFEGHVGHVQQVLPLPAEFELEHDELAATHPGDDGSSDGSQSEASGPDDQAWRSALAGQAFESFGADRPSPPRYMLTCALDSTIRLWHVRTGRCLRTFFGHVEGVWALAADTLRLVSGAQDRMVKVWDARTGKCERTFGGHSGAVNCIGLSDSRMCTGGEDGEARLYSFKSENGPTAAEVAVEGPSG